MTDPYLTLEESQALMAKGLTDARHAAINYVHKKLDDADMFEMGVADEIYTKTLTLIAYDLAEQRAELLEALNALYTVGILNVGELGDDPEVVAAQKKAMQAMENSERDE